MTETRTAVTEHGELEYEVEECDSCGSEFPADDAVEFTIGDREGAACPICAEHGPARFPEDEVVNLPASGIVLLIVVFPLFVVALAAAWPKVDHKETDDDTFRFIVVAMAGTALWLALAYAVLPVLLPMGVPP